MVLETNQDLKSKVSEHGVTLKDHEIRLTLAEKEKDMHEIAHKRIEKTLESQSADIETIKSSLLGLKHVSRTTNKILVWIAALITSYFVKYLLDLLFVK